MPSPTTSELPLPKSWDEFEDIVADIYRNQWGDPYVQRFGRSGQAQDGVDIIGRPRHLNGRFAAIQCKKTAALTSKMVFNEANKAKQFEPQITEFIVATTAIRDTTLQRQVWAKRDEYTFRLEVVFWEDLCLALSGIPGLLEKHFPAWAKATTTKARALEILAQASISDFRFDDCPPQYLYLPDIDIRLIVDRPDTGPEPFSEPWLDCFISRDHFVYKLHLYFRSSKVETFWLINADGGKVIIPYPTIEGERRISPLQYNLAKIINGQHRGNTLDDGLERTQISIDPELL